MKKIYDISVFIFLFALIFGTALPPLVYNLAIVFFIATTAVVIATRKLKVHINKYIIWWLVTCGFIIINITYSEYTENTYQFLIDAIVRFVILFSFVQYIVTLDDIKKVLNYLKIIGVLLVTFALFVERATFLQIGLGYSVGGLIIFSYPVTFIAMIWMYDLVKDPNFKNLFLTAFVYMACFFSTGRKAVIIPLIFLFTLMVIRSRKNVLKLARNLISYGILAVFVFYLSYNIPALYDLFGNRLEGLINSFLSNGSGVDESTLIRNSMIGYGLDMFLNRPIFGYGMDTFKSISNFGVYSHNNYIESLFSGGIIFFLLYYSIHFATINSLSNCLKKEIPYADFFLAFIFAQLFFDWGSISYFIYITNILLCMATSVSYIGKKTVIKSPL